MREIKLKETAQSLAMNPNRHVGRGDPQGIEIRKDRGTKTNVQLGSFSTGVTITLAHSTKRVCARIRNNPNDIGTCFQRGDTLTSQDPRTTCAVAS